MKHQKQTSYSEMTADELRQATQHFDEEFVADQAKPITAKMKARWERALAKEQAPENGHADRTISVKVDRTLLDRCNALAKKKQLSRDELVARGLRALLAAEGE